MSELSSAIGRYRLAGERLASWRKASRQISRRQYTEDEIQSSLRENEEAVGEALDALWEAQEDARIRAEAFAETVCRHWDRSNGAFGPFLVVKDSAVWKIAVAIGRAMEAL